MHRHWFWLPTWLTGSAPIEKVNAAADPGLSSYVELMPGDLIYTGTPAGVGPILRGDFVEGGIEGVGTIANRFV